MTITEWTVYARDGRSLEVAGEVRNDGDKRFQAVDFVVRFYDAQDKLVSVESGSMGGRFVERGERGRFKFLFYVDPESVAWYRVEVATPR